MTGIMISQCECRRCEMKVNREVTVRASLSASFLRNAKDSAHATALAQTGSALARNSRSVGRLIMCH